MKHPLSVLYDLVDMLRTLAECLEHDTFLSGTVHTVCRYPTVVPMNIHHDILHATLLRLNELFGRDRTTSMRMSLHPADRIHGRTSDTNHFPNLNICQADNVLCNRLPNVHLDQLLRLYDRQCLDILSIVIDPFPIDMCLVDMKRMSYSIDQSMCRQRMELEEAKENGFKFSRSEISNGISLSYHNLVP